MTQLPAFMSIEELSEVLDIPVSTIRGWRAAGEGPPAYKVGGRLRYTMTDVVTWLESRRDEGGAR